MTIKISKVHFSAYAFLRDCTMTVIVLWLTSPYQDHFNNWIVYGVLWIGWIVFAFLSEPASFKKMMTARESLVVVIWPCVMGMMWLFGWAQFAIYQFTICFLLICFSYYAHSKSIRSLKWFVMVGIIYIILIDIHSIQRLMINPEISRILANSNKYITEQFAGPFMANFSHITSITLISISMLFIVLEKRYKTYQRIFFFLLVLLNTYLMILAEYSLSLFVYIGFCVYVVVFHSGNRKYRYIKLLGMALSIGLLLLFLGDILIGIGNSINSAHISKRLVDIGQLFKYGTVRAGSDVADRFTLYALSINTFFEHPVFGVGGAVYRANGLVGGHSTVLDNFAYYGIAVGAFFIIYLIKIYQNGAKYFDEEHRKIYLLVFIMFLINCLTNTCYNEHILFSTFFMCPSIILCLQYSKKSDGAE